MAGRTVTGDSRSQVLLRVWGLTRADAEAAERLARVSEAAAEWTIIDVAVSVGARCTIQRRDPGALAWGAAKYKAWAFYQVAAGDSA